MRLFVEHDGLLVGVEDRTEVLAATLWCNPLREACRFDPAWPGGRVLSWSGTLGEDLFERHPPTWLAPGHKAFAGVCDRLAPELEAGGGQWCFLPHCRHVLNDVQSCVRFLEERASQPFAVAFAPASMLEPSMLEALEDHLERGFEALAARCPMLVLEDVVPADDGQSLCAVPLGQGVLPAERMRGLIEEFLPSETPVYLRFGAVDKQLRWLR